MCWHISRTLLSPERFEMETMAVKLQVTETLKAIMDRTATSDYTDRFGVPLSPAPLRAVSVNAAKALMDIFPIRQGENRLRIEGSGGNVIFNVIVPQNPCKDGKRENKITDREEIAWWVYLAMMIALVIYGFQDSAAAETLLRAIGTHSHF